MRIRSLVTAAVLGALALSGVSLPRSASAESLEMVGPADQGETTTFNLYLPLTHTGALEQLLSQQTDSSSPNYHHWLTPAQFKQQFGPSPADLARAKSILQAAGFSIVAEHTQSLQVQGRVGDVERLFSTHLNQMKNGKGQIELAAANHGRLDLPQTLAAMGAVIPEFAPHLTAHVHSQLAPLAGSGSIAFSPASGSTSPQDRLANSISGFFADDLNEAYQLPSFRAEVTPRHSHQPAQIAGVGATIGIVISSIIDPADLVASFDQSFTLRGRPPENQDYSAVSNLPLPTVTVHRIGKGSGAFAPGTPDSDEASLDTQMSLGTAPGAKEILYDMPTLSDANVAAAYTQVNDENLVDVVSSSFGECELDFLAINNGGTDFTGILKTFHALFQQGNAQGITFLASSGDSGAPACLSTQFQNDPQNGTNFVLGVQNPADDPNVTGVGGTNLQTAGTPTPADVTRVSENADFDPRAPAEFGLPDGSIVTVGNNTWGSGGGFSQIFSKPAYQFLVNTGSNRHRAVPDVSLMMGGCPGDATNNCLALPRSFVLVWIGGGLFGLIGTSSSSPEMAGVLAEAVELNGGRLGNVNPMIYGLSLLQTVLGGTHAPKAVQYFHRDISGNNNGFTVEPGQAYSEVLGNSTLDVKNFLGLQFAPAAGPPGTATNP